MNPKNYEPIKFEFFQTDMERIMYFLENTKKCLKTLSGDTAYLLERECSSIKRDLQHKIDIHRERGEWV